MTSTSEHIIHDMKNKSECPRRGQKHRSKKVERLQCLYTSCRAYEIATAAKQRDLKVDHNTSVSEMAK